MVCYVCVFMVGLCVFCVDLCDANSVDVLDEGLRLFCVMCDVMSVGVCFGGAFCASVVGVLLVSFCCVLWFVLMSYVCFVRYVDVRLVVCVLCCVFCVVLLLVRVCVYVCVSLLCFVLLDYDDDDNYYDADYDDHDDVCVFVF